MCVIAGVDGGEAMFAGEQRKCRSGVTLGVERYPSQGLTSILDHDGAGSGEAIASDDGDPQGGLGAAGLVMEFRGQSGFRGETTCVSSGQCHCGQCQSGTQCCYQLKPPTAADQTSHVGLLQISRKSRSSPMCGSVHPLYPAGAWASQRRSGDLP